MVSLVLPVEISEPLWSKPQEAANQYVNPFQNK